MSIRQTISKGDLKKFISWKFGNKCKVSIRHYLSDSVKFELFRKQQDQFCTIHNSHYIFKFMDAVYNPEGLKLTFSFSSKDLGNVIDTVKYYQRNKNLAYAVSFPDITLKNQK